MVALSPRPLLAVALLSIVGCSPEARRVRDGGPGADPGNKGLVMHTYLDPHAADTTLWPGRAPAMVQLLGKGIVPPPAYPSPQEAPSTAQQRTFNSGRRADPRRQADSSR